MSKVSSGICVIIVIVLLVCNVIFCGSKKEGFHIDELFSYEQVGNTDYPKPEIDRPDEPCLNHWHSREYYEDYLTINDEEAFNIAAFYKSASMNTAHPPLYLTMLGMHISAFFRNHFTKWSGITFNLIFYVLTLIMVFDISLLILKKETSALLSMAFYGASIGAVSCAIYIRMYMMMAFFMAAFADVHIRMINRGPDENNSLKKRMPLYAMTALVLILGELTHYYFIIFAFFVCFGYWLTLLLTGHFRLLKEYTVTCIVGLIGYFCIWPIFFRDIFSEERGVEAINNFNNIYKDTSVQAMDYLYEIDKHVTSGYGRWMIFILLILILIKLLYKKNIRLFFENNDGIKISYKPIKNESVNDGINIFKISSGLFMVLYILAASACTSFVIAKIAPVRWNDIFKEIRYILPLFAFFDIAFIYFIDKIFFRFYNSIISRIVICVIIVYLMELGYFFPGVDFIYKGADEQVEMLEQFSDDRALFISGFNYMCSNLNVYFTKHKAVYQTTPAEISKLKDVLKDSDDKEIVVYVSDEIYGSDNIIIDIKNELQAKELYMLFHTEGMFRANVYLLKF